MVLSLLCHDWSDTGRCMDGPTGLEILSLFQGWTTWRLLWSEVSRQLEHVWESLSTLEQCGCSSLCLGGRARWGGRLERRCGIFFPVFEEAHAQSKQLQIDSQLPCGVTVSARSLHPCFLVLGCEHFRVLHRWSPAVTLQFYWSNMWIFLPTVWFLNAFHQEKEARVSPFLNLDDDELLPAKGRTASFELGISCSVCASASLLTIPLLCFLWGFPASHQVNSCQKNNKHKSQNQPNKTQKTPNNNNH